VGIRGETDRNVRSGGKMERARGKAKQKTSAKVGKMVG